MIRRFFSLLLAACMSASLLMLPAAAAPAAGFNDISDRTTLAAAECLRLLGAMDGYTGGAFRPEGQVTRAQFCKMATFVIKDGPSLVNRYKTVTKFPDVKPSHWAAAYINLASSPNPGVVSGGEDKADKSIIKGFMDGKFHPEQVVSVGQAVTVLMRLLGYTDADMGGIWPDGYMAAATTNGLLDGVSANASAPLVRGQAARLLVNLLLCETKDGGVYGKSIANDSKKGMLTTSTASGSDGRDTAMRVDSTSYSMAGGKASTGALNGMKGLLLLNKAGQVMTFVPEISGVSRTVTVAAATTEKLTATSGESYAIPGTTTMVVNGKETTWSDGQSWLSPGMSVTLYIGSGGAVEHIFVGAGTASTAAVVVYASGSTEGFSGLAGGNTRYSLYKNGAPATAGDMRPYDVAIYDPATNSIRVSDTRLTGVYEDATPNLSNPAKIHLMGADFDVLSTAMDTVSKLKLGSAITLLLTEDAKVAGAVPAGTSGAAGNALGIAEKLSATEATVRLLCGGEQVSGKTSLTQSSVDAMLGQLVSVSSDRKGAIGLGRLVGSVFGDLDVTAKKLGSKLLSENVTIYQAKSGSVEAIGLSQIPSARIPSSGVVYARTNWAGRVDLLILSNVTGSDYRFGRLRYIMGEAQVGSNDPITGRPTVVHTPDTIAVEYGNGERIGPFPVKNFTVVDDKELRDGDYVGVTVDKNGMFFDTFLILDKYGSVANSAWSSPTSVTVGGRSYTVPSDVLCYNKTNGKWVSLDEARAFAKSSTLYTDKSGYVRIVEVQ